jgi:hypothetical protein
MIIFAEVSLRGQIKNYFYKIFKKFQSLGWSSLRSPRKSSKARKRRLRRSEKRTGEIIIVSPLS